MTFCTCKFCPCDYTVNVYLGDRSISGLFVAVVLVVHVVVVVVLVVAVVLVVVVGNDVASMTAAVVKSAWKL